MKNRTILLLGVLGIILLLSSCAAGPNTMVDMPAPDGGTAGFLLGLWHGFIAPVTFFISLFTENINLYEVYNTGGWYDFGFVLGAGIIFGGGSKATCTKKSM